MADASDSKSDDLHHVGSSPTICINSIKERK